MSKFSNESNAAVAERSEEQLVQEATQYRHERASTRLDRRKLITNLSMAAGAAGMLGVAGCSNAGPAAVAPGNTSPTVQDILNFALNLEYFEASYYSYIVTGAGLPASLMGTSPGTVTGGQQVTFQYSAIANIAANLMTEEVEHVQLLIATINSVFGAGAAISMPNLNLAAAGAVTNDATFVATSRTIEGVGVSAYAGGAQYLTSNIVALDYAAQILSTESQHEGALRQACIYFPSGTITSPAADALDTPPTVTEFFNTNNSTGLALARTISQVLGIVYTGPNAATTTPATGITKGGFFPSGFNGNIFST